MPVTIIDKGNYVQIDRGEPSRRFVVKPFDVNVIGTDKISIGDGLKNDWSFLASDVVGFTFTDIYDLKDQLLLLNNDYHVQVSNFQTIENTLQNIYEAVYELEFTAENISLNAEQINLNTDDVEEKLDTLNSKDFATETTLQLIKENSDSLIDYFNFGAAGNIPSALNGTVEFDVSTGLSSIGFHLIPPVGGKVQFEGTFDGTNWTPITFREIGVNGYAQTSDIEEDFIGSISALRKFRVKTITAGSTTGTIIGKFTQAVSTLEGIEHTNPPHNFGYAPVHKDFEFTTVQTSTNIWTPTSGKKFVVTDLLISCGSSGPTTISLFDNTNTSGNIITKFRLPSNTVVPIQLKTPFVSSTINNILRLTNSPAADIFGVLHGYEI